MTRRALVAALCALLAAHARAAAGDDPYAGLETVAGESHQHAATLYMLERLAKQPPVPGFPKRLHEHGSAAAAFDAMRKGGFDWGSLSHHDTNYPGHMANISIDPTSEKYRWWQARVSKDGFPGADPPWNEAVALSRIASEKTVEGEGGFLAFTGREFTNYASTPSGVGPREGGHKILILPGVTKGLCAADATLHGDEYCADEYHLYRWLVTTREGQGILIQAHPGIPQKMDLRPMHPANAPGGFSDAFVQGIEVSNSWQDPQYEVNYQRMLATGYRVFPAMGTDSHNATQQGREASARLGATVCWVEARTRAALIRAMHERRCYFATASRPELRFAARAAPDAPWVAMGGLVDAPDGRLEVRVEAINDPRNFDADPEMGRRFDVLELVDASDRVLASEKCARAADGRDTCALSLARLVVSSGAIYPRIRMLRSKPESCRSKDTPKLLVNCGKIVIGGAIYVNWPAYLARKSPFRQCRFGRDDVPCGTPGCLPPELDRDQDGFPDGCDVCPDVDNPDQADENRDGFGDACPRTPA